MSILSVVQEAAPKLGIARPSVLVADTGATSVEVQTALRDAAAEIARRYDWQILRGTHTITGDGVATDFAFPPNYLRMPKKAQLWASSTPYSPLTHYRDADQWLGFTVQSHLPVLGGWTIAEGRFAISPVRALAETVKFLFIKNLMWDVAALNAPKADFDNDTDVFRIANGQGERSDEELLKYGLIVKYKQAKGRPHAADLDTFEDALAVKVGADRGSGPLNMSNAGRPKFGSTYAWPGVIVP